MSKYIFLKEVADIIMGQSPASSTYNNEGKGLPFYQGKAEFGLRYPIVKKWCSAPLKIADQGDILLSVRAPVGPTNICNIKSCIGRGLAAIRCKENKADHLFIWFYLRSIEKRIASKGVGSTFTAIGREEISKIQVPSVNYFVQRKIAAILEKAESAREKRREANRLTDEFLKSAFLEMFGDPIRNNEKLNLRTIESLASKERHAIKRGPFGGDLKKEIFVKSGYKVYEQKNVIYNELSLGEYYIDANKFNQMEAFEIKPGDLIISCSGTIGKIAIVPSGIEKGIINQTLLKITLNKKEILPVYFKYLFETETLQKYLFGYMHGSAMKNVTSVSYLKNIKLPIALIEQQQKFADLVRKVEKLKEKQSESGNELNNLFNSLMQRAFRGELV